MHLQNSTIIKTSPSITFFFFFLFEYFKLGNCLSNFLLSRSNYPDLYSVAFLLLRFKNNTVFWIPLFFSSLALSTMLASQLRGIGWAQRGLLCLGRKNMTDIYQCLINSVAKVNLQQQQRLFYNAISSVSDIIEFPWLFIFLVLKISNLFWKSGGNALAGSLSCNFQVATTLVCNCIFASDSVCLLYALPSIKVKNTLYGNWEPCLCSTGGKMSL